MKSDIGPLFAVSQSTEKDSIPYLMERDLPKSEIEEIIWELNASWDYDLRESGTKKTLTDQLYGVSKSHLLKAIEICIYELMELEADDFDWDYATKADYIAYLISQGFVFTKKVLRKLEDIEPDFCPDWYSFDQFDEVIERLIDEEELEADLLAYGIDIIEGNEDDPTDEDDDCVEDYDEDCEDEEDEEIEVLRSRKNSTASSKKDALKTDSYDLSVVNMKGISADKLEQQILNAHQKIYKEKQLKIPFKNFNIMLEGPSGVGKTAFVKHICEKNKMDYLEIQASDMFSHYIGDTEKNTKKIFQKCEKEKKILIINEADSFFRSRELSSHSWENTMVNEFLVCMEEFRGILCVTTNLYDDFDKASLRRFAHIIEISYLKPEGNIKLFEKYVTESLTKEKLNSQVEKELKSMRFLAPGDFKVVLQKNYFSGDEISNEEVLSQLREINNERRQGVISLQ